MIEKNILKYKLGNESRVSFEVDKNNEEFALIYSSDTPLQEFISDSIKLLQELDKELKDKGKLGKKIYD